MPTERTAVIYARVSTARQASEELPLDSQVEKCRQKAEALGARVSHVFIDAGLSGRSDRRPEFQAALEFCETMSPDFFITWSTSRFARNRYDAAVYKRHLAACGTEIEYISIPLDRGSDGGWALEAVLEVFDELQSRQTASDTKRSMIKNAQSGHWNGGKPPFGYRAAPDLYDPRRRRLEPVREEAIIAHEIFALRAAGNGAKTIAYVLNQKSKINRNRQWSKASIAALLRNEALVGRTVFGKKDRMTGRRRSRDKWIVVQSHDPIIDIDLWDRVQTEMDRETPKQDSGSPHSRFLFTGLLKCGRCGASLQTESAKGRSRRYYYYNCRSAQKLGACSNRRMQAHSFDEWLVDIICDQVLTPANLKQAVMDLREAAEEWASERAGRREATLKQLGDIEKRTSKIYELLELHGKNAPHLGDLTRRLRSNNLQIQRLENDLTAINAEQAPEITIMEDEASELYDFLRRSIKDNKNPKRIRSFFATFIDGITVLDDTVEITYSPERLSMAKQMVPTKRNWLPGTPLKGTIHAVVGLPTRWWRAA